MVLRKLDVGGVVAVGARNQKCPFQEEPMIVAAAALQSDEQYGPAEISLGR
jgi:hypothetical protein